jgi:alpha-beta hydrolase superfamily lysophospholipase
MPRPLSDILETELHGECLVPAQHEAALLIVHGIGEHGGRYLSAVRDLAARRIACIVYDQRWHGRSPGLRGDIESFTTLVDDLRRIAAGVRRAYSGLPLFLWGHSLGSLVVILAAGSLSHELRGVATSGCPINVFRRAGPWLSVPVRAISALTPRLRVRSHFDAADLTHDVAVQRAYDADPLVVHALTVRTVNGFFAACRDARHAAPRLTLPWLAVHGEEDRVAPNEGSRSLVQLLGSPDKSLVVYPGQRHEIHNELEPARSRFLGDLERWIVERRRR